MTSAAVNGSVPSATRTHTWSSFDNPQALSIRQSNGNQAQVAFLYGTEHQRIREVSSQTVAGATSQKTLAVLHPDNAGALYFERETISSGVGAGTANAVQNRHYLTAEKGAFLLITSNTSLQANPTATTLANAEQRYWHKDHLGSIVASTNQNLTVIERLAYEPFGKRRFASGQYDQAGSIDAQTTTRGFTGHEHLDSLDFIHMNARVYDPDIGRFLSPDPTVPGAHNPQAFNRFAYAFNNPLNLVDRDGFEPTAGPHGYADGSKDQPASGSGPATSSQGTPATGSALGANPPNKAGPDQIPGYVGYVPAPDTPKSKVEITLDWYDRNIANPMMAIPMVGAVMKAPSVAVKAASNLGKAVAANNAAVDAKAAAAKAKELAERAAQIHSKLDPIAARSRTTAVVETTVGKNIVASGGRDLNPAQRAALTANEVAAKSPGTHAEVTALQEAAKQGLNPASIATTTNICSGCAAAIEQAGGVLTGPRSAVFPK